MFEKFRSFCKLIKSLLIWFKATNLLLRLIYVLNLCTADKLSYFYIIRSRALIYLSTGEDSSSY